MPYDREELQNALFVLRDEDYKAFHAKLVPNIKPDKIIGVRTPVLRRFAKDFAKAPEAKDFLSDLPHKYYEEDNLHAFLLEQVRDYDALIASLDIFLPYVDNWATCDMLNPKIFRKNTDALVKDAMRYISSSQTYTVRFGIGIFMRYFLDEKYSPEIPEAVARIHSDEYYINMMRAWFFATALSKKYEKILPYITEGRLDLWTHNKTIRKAIESSRISKEQKDYLRTLKIQSIF